MVPLRPDMIGQSTWYEAFEDGDGFAVNITAGSGDCQAGCIDQHVWRYHVDRVGNVELTGEDGEPVEVTRPAKAAKAMSASWFSCPLVRSARSSRSRRIPTVTPDPSPTPM